MTRIHLLDPAHDIVLCSEQKYVPALLLGAMLDRLVPGQRILLHSVIPKLIYFTIF
ncbi:hypothetical protein RCH14_000136 [Massilia sp. MP_M2]